MPDQRLEKTRATLPAGYQYGDALDRESPLTVADLERTKRGLALGNVLSAKTQADAIAAIDDELVRGSFTNWSACSQRIENA